MNNTFDHATDHSAHNQKQGSAKKTTAKTTNVFDKSNSNSRVTVSNDQSIVTSVISSGSSDIELKKSYINKNAKPVKPEPQRWWPAKRTVNKSIIKRMLTLSDFKKRRSSLKLEQENQEDDNTTFYGGQSFK